MPLNVAVDHYTLLLEGVSSSGLRDVHAFATNLATALTVEARLSPAQRQTLVDYAYGGEVGIVHDYLEQNHVGHAVALLTTSKDLCEFTAEELQRFGFDSGELLAAQNSENTVPTDGLAWIIVS